MKNVPISTPFTSIRFSLGQRGGWPLIMFLTPDGEAILGRHLFPAGFQVRTTRLSASTRLSQTTGMRNGTRPSGTAQALNKGLQKV